MSDNTTAVRYSSGNIHLDQNEDLVLDYALLEAYGKQANNLNTQTIEKISGYLKGNVWIVKCLNSGATVSAKVREQVLAGLFRPEEE